MRFGSLILITILAFYYNSTSCPKVSRRHDPLFSPLPSLLSSLCMQHFDISSSHLCTVVSSKRIVCITLSSQKGGKCGPRDKLKKIKQDRLYKLCVHVYIYIVYRYYFTPWPSGQHLFLILLALTALNIVIVVFAYVNHLSCCPITKLQEILYANCRKFRLLLKIHCLSGKCAGGLKRMKSNGNELKALESANWKRLWLWSGCDNQHWRLNQGKGRRCCIATVKTFRQAHYIWTHTYIYSRQPSPSLCYIATAQEIYTKAKLNKRMEIKFSSFDWVNRICCP